MINCQTKSALGEGLPDLYQRLVRALDTELLREDIRETRATCGDCAMQPALRGPRAKVTYRPDLKCCTFDPWIPNFMVGAMLEDKGLGEAGRRAVERKLASIEECTPLGLRASTDFQRRFLRKDEHEFGNREDWLCPYFDRAQNNCGIWRYRGNVCISFFCQSDAGTRGLRFWEEFGDLLHLIELSVMEECLVQLDFSPRQMSDLLPLIDRQTHMMHRRLPAITPAESIKMWNHYDDPAEFFRKCHRIAANLNPREIREVVGEAGARAVQRVRERRAKMKL